MADDDARGGTGTAWTTLELESSMAQSLVVAATPASAKALKPVVPRPVQV